MYSIFTIILLDLVARSQATGLAANRTSDLPDSPYYSTIRHLADSKKARYVPTDELLDKVASNLVGTLSAEASKIPWFHDADLLNASFGALAHIASLSRVTLTPSLPYRPKLHPRPDGSAHSLAGYWPVARPCRSCGVLYRPQLRRKAVPTIQTHASHSDNVSTRVVLPGWARQVFTRTGWDPALLETKLGDAKNESDILSVGTGILWRDLKRNLPLAARELKGDVLTEAEQERANRGKNDFWPAFWFANIFMNTAPWTPLIMPFILKVVPAKYIVPAQLDVKTEPRLARLVAMKTKGRSAFDEEKSSEES